MHPMWKDISKAPNLVSMARVLLAPVMLALAVADKPGWFIGAFLFAEFTDVLDGFLARILDQRTELGSHLDSWSDVIIYSTAAACAWLLWPHIILDELAWFVLIVLSFVVPSVVGFLKFHHFTGYHTRGVKVAVAVTVIGYVLLFTGLAQWPFRLAALLCLYAAIEEVAITLLTSREQVDVKSVWQAVRARRRQTPDR